MNIEYLKRKMVLLFACSCCLSEIPCSWLPRLFTVEALLVLPDGCLLCFLLFLIFYKLKIFKKFVGAWCPKTVFSLFFRFLMKKSRRSEKHKWRTFPAISQVKTGSQEHERSMRYESPSLLRPQTQKWKLSFLRTSCLWFHCLLIGSYRSLNDRSFGSAWISVSLFLVEKQAVYLILFLLFVGEQHHRRSKSVRTRKISKTKKTTSKFAIARETLDYLKSQATTLTSHPKPQALSSLFLLIQLS